MTKLDFIKAASPRVRWETWRALGCQTITENTKYLAGNTVYKLMVPTQLGSVLIFCSKEIVKGKKGFTGDWSKLKAVNYIPWDPSLNTGHIAELTFSVPTGSMGVGNNFIIVPGLYLITTAEDAEEENITELYPRKDFIPFDPAYLIWDENEVNSKPNLSMDDSVIIDEKDYENCLKCLGYPFITEDELEYSREDILNLAIKPALEEYFHWLPFERIEEYPVTGDVQIIPMPNDAYDVLGISVQQRGTHGSGNITNTLLRYFDEAAYGSFNYSGMTGVYRGIGRPHTITTAPDNFISNRALTQATINLNTRVHFDKLYQKDPVTGLEYRAIRLSSNKQGVFNVHWAVHSLNFNDVEYQQRQNVFKYCQAEIMQLFGNLRRQAKADIPGAIDYSTWVEEAKTMKQEVVEDWKQLVKASSIMRGSL